MDLDPDIDPEVRLKLTKAGFDLLEEIHADGHADPRRTYAAGSATTGSPRGGWHRGALLNLRLRPSLYSPVRQTTLGSSRLRPSGTR